MDIDYYQTPEQQKLAFQRYSKKNFWSLLNLFTIVNLYWGGKVRFSCRMEPKDRFSFTFIAGSELLTMSLDAYNSDERITANRIFEGWIKNEICTVRDALDFILDTTTEPKEKPSNEGQPIDNNYDLTDDGTGKKYDNGKPMAGTLTDVFSRALMAVGACIEFGTHKYPDPKNWQLVDNGIKRYRDAMVRHLLKYNAGIDKDEETKLPHLAHMAWNALAILELYMQEHKDELDKEIFK